MSEIKVLPRADDFFDTQTLVSLVRLPRQRLKRLVFLVEKKRLSFTCSLFVRSSKRSFHRGISTMPSCGSDRSSAASMKEKKRAVRQLANQLIVQLDILYPRLATFRQINSHLFCLIMQRVFQVSPAADLFQGDTDNRQHHERQVFSSLLSDLSTIMSMDLEHLNAAELAVKNPNHLFNLLEIFETASKYLGASSEGARKSAFVQTEPKVTVDAACCGGHNSSSSEASMPVAYANNSGDGFDVKAQAPPSPSSSLKTIPSSDTSSIPSMACSCPEVLRSTPEPCARCNPNGHKTLARQDTKETKVLRPIKRQPTLRVEDKVAALRDQLRQAKGESFALELGIKLHEALKLEEKAKTIEKKLDYYYNQQRQSRSSSRSRPVSVNVRSRSANSPRRKSISNRPGTQSRSASARSRINSRQTSAKSRQSSNIQQRPFRQSSLETVHLEQEPARLADVISKLDVSDPLSRETRTHLETMERNHRIFIENLKNDIRIRQNKATLGLADAVERELKRAGILRKDLLAWERLEAERHRALLDINRNVLVRESRLDRAVVHRRVEGFCNDAKSKLAMARARHEQIVRLELERKMKDEKATLLETRKLVRERTELDERKNRQLLVAVESLYRTQFDAAREKMSREEETLKTRISQNSRLLFDMQRQMKDSVRGIGIDLS